MNTEQQQKRASEIVRIVLDNALYRISKVHGRDRLALQKEYKEWMLSSSFNDEVWFSTNNDRNDNKIS